MSEGIEHMGAPQWQVVLCLAAAWTLTFLALSKGVKSTGKVSLYSRTSVAGTLMTRFWYRWLKPQEHKLCIAFSDLPLYCDYVQTGKTVLSGEFSPVAFNR